jgi:TP901 family phage tail tape measure protein
MANPKGIIMRKDIIEDEALKWGEVYTENIKEAIKQNKILVESVKELNKQVQAFKVANSQKDYITAKQAEALATQQAIDAIKKQEAAEISADKIKRSAIATMEAERKAKQAVHDAENKVQKAKQAGQKQTSEEIINQRILAKNADNHALANSKLASEYDKLTAKARIAATALQNILIAGKRADETTAQYNIRLQQAQIEFDQLQSRVITANRAIGKFNDNVGNYPQEAANAIKDLIGAFGLVIGIDTFVSVTKEAFNIIKDFENEVVNLAAIAGKTREEIAPLEAEIRNVAKASINSATDVAKLATELIKLGSTPEEAEKLLAPINNLSIALKASAEDSATLVKSLLNSFGEGAEEAARFTDVLAESANRSALDFQGLRDAFSYLAPTSRALGLSIEKTAAILGVLADNGIKAESAGRLTSTAFAKLAKEGLTLDDALAKINKAQKEGKSNLEVLAIATKLFGAEAGKIGLILANNTQKVDENTVAYQNSGGALQELTDKQLKSVNSELEILSSAWEEYILNTNEAAGGTRAITSVLRLLSSNLDIIVDGIVIAGSVWLAYRASLILARVQQSLMAITLKTSSVAQIENTVATRVGADAQLASAGATKTATTAFQKFNLALKANVLGIIVAALAGAIYLFNKFNVSLEESTKEIQDSTAAFLKNREIVAKNAISINTLSDRYDVLKAKSKLTTAEQKELNKIIEILAKTVPGAVIEVDKYGDALGINTVKTREWVKANKEASEAGRLVKLEQNQQNLKRHIEEQKTLNRINKEGYGVQIEGIGLVIKQDGVLRTRRLSGDRLLNAVENKIFKDRVKANEDALDLARQNIKDLSGVTAAEIKVAKAREEAAKQQRANRPRTIAMIDAEIQAQEELISTLSDKTGKEGRAVQAKIKALNEERDLIFNNNKATSDDGEKLIKKQLDNAKKVRDAIYNLSQFRYSNAIETNQEIIDNEKSTLEEKLNALYENAQLTTSKNEETLRHELENNAFEGKELEKLTALKRKLYIRSANDRIEAIISGKLKNEEMTDEELLVLEKYLAERKKLLKNQTNDEEKIKKEAPKELSDTFKKKIEDLAKFEKERNAKADEQIIVEQKRFRNKEIT